MQILDPAPVTPALSLWAAPAAVEPPSGAVIAVVLQFADIREPRGDGALMVCFSPERAAHDDVGMLLGEERDRVLDVTLVWDDAEQRLLQVIDRAPLRAACRPVRPLGGFDPGPRACAA